MIASSEDSTIAASCMRSSTTSRKRESCSRWISAARRTRPTSTRASAATSANRANRAHGIQVVNPDTLVNSAASGSVMTTCHSVFSTRAAAKYWPCPNEPLRAREIACSRLAPIAPVVAGATPTGDALASSRPLSSIRKLFVRALVKRYPPMKFDSNAGEKPAISTRRP